MNFWSYGDGSYLPQLRCGGYGVILYSGATLEEKEEIHRAAVPLLRADSVAETEYSAIEHALRYLYDERRDLLSPDTVLTICSDNKFLVDYFQEAYPLSDSYKQAEAIRQTIARLTGPCLLEVRWVWITREENAQADALSREGSTAAKRQIEAELRADRRGPAPVEPLNDQHFWAVVRKKLNGDIIPLDDWLFLCKHKTEWLEALNFELKVASEAVNGTHGHLPDTRHIQTHIDWVHQFVTKDALQPSLQPEGKAGQVAFPPFKPVIVSAPSSVSQRSRDPDFGKLVALELRAYNLGQGLPPEQQESLWAEKAAWLEALEMLLRQAIGNAVGTGVKRYERIILVTRRIIDVRNNVRVVKAPAERRAEEAAAAVTTESETAGVDYAAIMEREWAGRATSGDVRVLVTSGAAAWQTWLRPRATPDGSMRKAMVRHQITKVRAQHPCEHKNCIALLENALEGDAAKRLLGWITKQKRLPKAVRTQLSNVELRSLAGLSLFFEEPNEV